MKILFKHLLLVPILLFLFWSCSQKGGGQLSGKILGADGQPLAVAHVHVTEAGGDVFHPLQSVPTDSNGNFSVKLPAQKYLSILITAPYYEPLELPLVRNKTDESVALKVQLQGHRYLPDYKEVRITGNWLQFSVDKALLMNKNADGTFSLTVPVQGDTLAYQLIGLTPYKQGTAGTQQDLLIYDNRGDYKSIIKTKDSSVTVTFNPKKLPQNFNPDLPRVTVTQGSPETRQFMEAALLITKTMATWNEQRQQYVKKTGTNRGFRFNFSQLDSSLKALEKEAASDQLAKYIVFQKIILSQYGLHVPDTLIQYLGHHLAITDPLWAYTPQMMPFVYERTMGIEKALPALEQALPQIENKNTRAYVLIHLGMRAKYMRDQKKMAWVYQQLKEGYQDIPVVKYYLPQFNPESGISVGHKIPAFNVKNLDTGQEITNETLKGKYVLLDFWATWCAPCVSEMPNLHQAYEKFKDRNFTILSFSFDRKIEDVKKFRKGQWKMPWLNAFLDKTIRDKIAQAFEVSGIPKPILIDPEGKIIAMEADLRGQNLEKTLNKFLK